MALIVLVGGCKRLRTGAREEFGKIYSCPEERVEVRARDDLKYGDIILSGRATKTPPDEVRADPGRLAKWQSDRRAEDETLRDSLNERDVFEVKGCDHVSFFGCYHPDAEHGVATDVATCLEIPPERAPR